MAAVISWGDILQIKELGNLRQTFIANDGELNEKLFVKELRSVLPAEVSANVSAESLSHLFMKIDANSDGTVSWDEFVSFLFLSNAEQRNSTNNDQEAKKIFKLLNTQQHEAHHHNSAITTLMKVDGHPEQHEREIEKSVMSNKKRLDEFNKTTDEDEGDEEVDKDEEGDHEVTDTRGDLYMTGGTDGQLLAWDSHTLKYHNTIDLGLDWIMDAAHLTHTSRLVVTTASRVHVYELFKDRKKILQARKMGTVNPNILNNAAAVSVHYRLEPGTQNEWLFLGGDDGGMTCYIFLDSKNNQKAGHAYFDPLNVPAHLNFEDYVDLRRIDRLHDDHITQMRYIEELGCLLTSSLDGTLKLTQMNDAGRGQSKYSRRRVKYVFSGHTKAVRSFAWCRSIRMVASCGQERSIKVWAPYSLVHAELVGHKASVIQVVSISGKSRLASLDVDSGIRIWDVRTLTCLQSIRVAEQPTRLPDCRSSMDAIKRMAFDDDSGFLVTSSHRLGCWCPTKNDEDEMNFRLALPKRVPLSCVLWNSEFRQVITASHDGRIVVWDVETGQRVFWFTAYDGDGGIANIGNEKHTSRKSNDSGETLRGNPMRITSIAFDQHGRRILVGSHAGDAVRIYNFSNGKLLGILGKVKNTVILQKSLATTRSSTKQKRISSSVGNDSHEVITILSAKARRQHRRIRTRKRIEMKRNGALRDDVQLLSRIVRTKQKEKITDATKQKSNRRISLAFPETNKIYLRENCQEISCVACAMISPPSTSTTSQRWSSKAEKLPIIISTGWDKRIHIWKEGGHSEEANPTRDGEGHIQPYSKRIPESDATLLSSLHHSDDVTSLCFCPPETIVTACYGGVVIGWHVHSGAARFRCRFEHPVESMCWMGSSSGYLAVGRSSGQIAIFDVVNGNILQDCDGPFANDDQTTLLSILASDQRGEYVMCGDSSGFVHVFTTISTASSGGGWLHKFASFKAHDDRVTSLAHVEHSHATETFVLSASLDGTAAMWSLGGAPVGVFGQPVPWSIHDRKTWTKQGKSLNIASRVSSQSSSKKRRHRKRFARRKGPIQGHVPGTGEKGKGINLSSRRGARRGTMHTLQTMHLPGGILNINTGNVGSVGNAQDANIKDQSQATHSMATPHKVQQNNDAESDEPDVGKVWSRYDHESETCVSIVTIMRVDRQSNIVVGYNGMIDPRTSSKPILIELDLAQMLAQRKRTVRNKITWKLESRLTQCIGRVYKDRNAYEPFKVLFVFLSVETSSPLNPDWWVMDSGEKAHRLPEGDLSLAPRSLTMFNYMQQRDEEILGGPIERDSASRDTDSSDVDTKSEQSIDSDDVCMHTEVLEDGDSLLASPKSRHGGHGRRSSLDFMPDNQRLMFYQSKLSEGVSSQSSGMPIRPVTQKTPGADSLSSRGGKYAAAYNDIHSGVGSRAEGSYVRLMKARTESRNRAKVKDARKIHGPRGIPIEWTGQVTLIEPVAEGAVNARDFARQLMGLTKVSAPSSNKSGNTSKSKNKKNTKVTANSKEETRKRTSHLEDRLKTMEKQLAIDR